MRNTGTVPAPMNDYRANPNATAPYCHAMQHARSVGFAAHGKGPVFSTFTLPNYDNADGPWGSCVVYAPQDLGTLGDFGVIFLPIALTMWLALPVAIACGIKCNAEGNAVSPAHFVVVVCLLLFRCFVLLARITSRITRMN